MRIECRYPLPLDRAVVRSAWPELEARVEPDAALAVLVFLAELYVLLVAERPVVECACEDDAMGGVAIGLAFTSGSARFTLDYEQSLRESWHSVDRLRCEASFASPNVQLSLDLWLIGSVVLVIRVDPDEPGLAASVADLASGCFREVA